MEHTQETDIRRYLYLVQNRRYLFAGAAALIMTVAVIISYVMPPIYEAKTVVSIEKNLLDSIIKGIGDSQTGDDKVKALSTIMKSRTLVFKVINDLGFDTSKMTELQIEALINRTQEKTEINIEFNKASKKDIDYFVLSFRHRNPMIARDYVNTLVSRYIEENLSSHREGSFGANRFLMDQISVFKEKDNKLDAEITALKKNRTIIFYDRYLELQKRLDDLLVQYTESHPEVIRVKADIASLKLKFRASAEGGNGAEESEKGTVNMAYAASLKSRLVALEEEKNTNKKIYDELIATYGKSEMSAQAEIQDKAGTFRIVDPAVLPVKPVSPNRLKIMLMGIFGGVFGAFALIVMLDTLDQSIKNVDALKQFGAPVLAVIPHIENKNEMVKAKKKDRYLYSFSGLFVALLIAIIVWEFFR